MFSSLVFAFYLVVSPPQPVDIQTHRGGLQVCVISPNAPPNCQTYVSHTLYPSREACLAAVQAAAVEVTLANNRPDMVVRTACVAQSLQDYRLETLGADIGETL